MNHRDYHDDRPRDDLARDEHDASLLRTVPGLARIAAEAYWRSARWTAKASAEAGSRVLRAAVNGQDPGELFRSTGAEIRERTRRVLGIPERGPGERAAMTPEAAEAEREEARKALRERGEELLRRSRDVNFGEQAHPAYMRILEDLSPDEARILRLLAEEGPQPSVDIRSGLIPLQSTSELVAAGLNMIGSEAGCRHLDDVPAYLNNLHRLGLVWFSREALTDTQRYQVLEAQPEVDDALKSAGRTRTVRRSIHLTPFGRDFCELCLTAEPRDDLAAQAGEPNAGEDGARPG
jgi:Abortive infection alpha